MFCKLKTVQFHKYYKIISLDVSSVAWLVLRLTQRKDEVAE